MRRLPGDADIASSFYQAGGTALALLLGLRKSEDIDLFTEQTFDEDAIVRRTAELGGIVLLRDRGIVHVTVKDIRVSFLHYPYPLVDPTVDCEGTTLASLRDIAAMKTAAVSQRAEKK